jgi:hypothetical protein
MDGHLNGNWDIVIMGSIHRDAVRMRFDDWFELVQPRVELISETV